MRRGTVITILLTALCTAVLCWLWGEHRGGEETGQVPDTTRTVSIDTVVAVNPAPVDVSVINTKVVRLPLWISPAKRKIQEDSVLTVGVNNSANDSADVVIPVERKIYEDSSYRAVVSGAFVNLDTLEIYTRHEITTIRQTITRNKHWGISLQAGYGYTPGGFKPYLGIGISYSFLLF
ncbi:MAG: hypothetical protein K2M11_08545 [Paramuribaculum sp.]|nr:hypothetical protein [Paramuribaculum sp.]